MKFSIRTLFVVTTIAAVTALPLYRYSVNLYRTWTTPEPATTQLPIFANTTVNTSVSVADGGTIIIGGITIRPDGSRWVDGKMKKGPIK